MNDLGEFEQVHIVSYGLATLISDSVNKLQAIMVFGNKSPQRVRLKTSEDWYALAYLGLLENLAINVASLLDRAKHGKDTNCNFNELKLVLERCSDKVRFQNVIVEIDTLLQKYEGLVPDVLRNKRIAHKDLDELFSCVEYDLDLLEISRFLIEGYKTVSDALELSVGARLNMLDFTLIEKKYEESLKQPLNI